MNKSHRERYRDAARSKWINRSLGRGIQRRLIASIPAVLCLVTGCAPNYYNQYKKVHPEWDEVFPKRRASLQETLAALHEPSSDQDLVLVRSVKIWRTDVDPWREIAFGELQSGHFVPSASESYALIALRSCMFQPSSMRKELKETVTWYLLPKNELRGWHHYEFLQACARLLDSVPARGRLIATERKLLELAEERFPSREAQHPYWIYQEGIALVQAGRIEDARERLETGDRTVPVVRLVGEFVDEKRLSAGDRDPRREQGSEMSREVREKLIAALRAYEGSGAGSATGREAVREFLENGRFLPTGVAAMGFAQPLVVQALESLETDPTAPPLRIAELLTALANIHVSKGANTKAEELHRRALAIREDQLGTSHPQVAQSLAYIGDIRWQQGDLESGREFVERAVAIADAELPGKSPLLAGILDLRAVQYIQSGELAAGERLLQRALAARPPHSVDRGRELLLLALVDIARGELRRAERRLDRAVLGGEMLATQYPWVGGVVLSLRAHIAQRRGDRERTATLASRAAAMFELHRQFTVLSATEEEQRVSMETLRRWVDFTLSLALGSQTPLGERLAMMMLLQHKARVLDAVRADLLRRHLDPADQTLIERLNDVRGRLATLVLAGPEKGNADAHGEAVHDFENQALRIEAEMIARARDSEGDGARVNVSRVQDRIPPGAALVEFRVYRRFEPSEYPSRPYYQRLSPPRYVACVLRASGDPRCLDLGNAEEIDRLARAFREALVDRLHRLYIPTGRSLDAKVMEPIRRLLGDERSLLLSPDGLLNLVPFAALVDEQGQHLIDRFRFTYLTTGRELLREYPGVPHATAPVIVADPNFNADPDTYELQVSAESSSAAQLRSVAIADLHFARLPGTAREAREVGSVVPGARLLLGDAATEGAVKRLSAPRILHIATHGFFLSAETASVSSRRSDDFLLRPGTIGENPMLRAGLALAGANQRSGAYEDGLLTAFEVAGMDLRGTELVVLSACETGVGDVSIGEGVYGLRRALVLAGSETQVMSLWKISDDGTRILMVDYYRGLARGMGRSEALGEAQLAMKKDTATRHPFYWAAFIASGVNVSRTASTDERERLVEEAARSDREQAEKSERELATRRYMLDEAGWSVVDENRRRRGPREGEVWLTLDELRSILQERERSGVQK